MPKYPGYIGILMPELPQNPFTSKKTIPPFRHAAIKTEFGTTRIHEGFRKLPTRFYLNKLAKPDNPKDC
jgi:hypothetical protein